MSQVLAACLPGTVTATVSTGSDGTSNWEAVQRQVGQHGDEQDTLGCPLSNSSVKLGRYPWKIPLKMSPKKSLKMVSK